MEWSCASRPSHDCRVMGSVPHLDKPIVKPFDPFEAAKLPYPITTYQPVYFCAENMADVKTKVSRFCDSLHRPFFPQFCSETQTIMSSRAVELMERTSTVQLQAQKQADFFEAPKSKE
mmetsp:Transcript_7133/g.19884  ORF Transcript_7133/g.19884 Transcript_7133/m.19884 type:complete len:118 (-) Transcript_7133:67-420(-)